METVLYHSNSFMKRLWCLIVYIKMFSQEYEDDDEDLEDLEDKEKVTLNTYNKYLQ